MTIVYGSLSFGSEWKHLCSNHQEYHLSSTSAGLYFAESSFFSLMSLQSSLYTLFQEYKYNTIFTNFALSKQTIMEEKKEISLEIKPEIAKGTYSNLAIITHSHSEFIIDFATMLPGLPKPDIGNRIIMTPEHAKRLLNALMDNVTKYENQFGLISLGGQPQQDNTFNLGDLPQFGPGGAKS